MSRPYTCGLSNNHSSQGITSVLHFLKFHIDSSRLFILHSNRVLAISGSRVLEKAVLGCCCTVFQALPRRSEKVKFITGRCCVSEGRLMSTFTQRKRNTPGGHCLNRIDLVVETGSGGAEVENDAGCSGADDAVIKSLSGCGIIAIVFFQKRLGVDDKAGDPCRLPAA